MVLGLLLCSVRFTVPPKRGHFFCNCIPIPSVGLVISIDRVVGIDHPRFHKTNVLRLAPPSAFFCAVRIWHRFFPTFGSLPTRRDDGLFHSRTFLSRDWAWLTRDRTIT